MPDRIFKSTDQWALGADSLPGETEPQRTLLCLRSLDLHIRGQSRDQALDHERLTEQARAVQAPASAVEECVGQLQGASLTPEQAAIVERLARASASLRKAAGALPQPRRRRK